MTKKLLIWGRGGHSRVVCDNIDREVFCLDDFSFMLNTDDEFLVSWYPPIEYEIFVAIGDNKERERLTLRFINLGYTIPTIVSPSSIISKKSELSQGVFVGPGACINAYVTVETGAIINTCSSIDHDCTIGSFSHIAPGVHLCGGVTVGSKVLVGVGTSVIPKIFIQSDITIAGGSSVNKSLFIEGTYAGNPVKLKKIKEIL